MPTRDPKLSYVNIKQSPLESFIDFVERLWMAIEQVESWLVQLEVMTEMAQANANDTYKQIILSLPMDPPPTLEMMVEVCAKRAAILEPQKRGEGSQRMVAAATPHKQHNTPLHCFICRQEGHVIIFQWDKGQRDPLLIIEWVFLSHLQSKSITKPQELVAQLIRKARGRLCELVGCDISYIHLPFKYQQANYQKRCWSSCSKKTRLCSLL